MDHITFESMSTAQAAKGREVLADCLRGEDLTAWLARLVVTTEGEYRLALKRPVKTRAQWEADRFQELLRLRTKVANAPMGERGAAESQLSAAEAAKPEDGRDPAWFIVEAVHLPIGEALALLREPERNPEPEAAERVRQGADLRERQRLAEEEYRREREARQIRDAQEARDRERLAEQFRYHDWEQLPGWAKLAYTLALVHERHGQGQLAAELREIADRTVMGLSSNDIVGRARVGDSGPLLRTGPAWPAARWW